MKPEASPAQLDLLAPVAPRTWPRWYRPTALRPAANRRVALGLHPFGLELGPEAATCGACRHLIGERWNKCRFVDVGTAETDVVQRWRACARFDKR